ncbi:uncharacterized protein C8Q71DRAFT_858533 [Rhodofomes roseus]|uniref:DUF7726 domain-containing protein n=1 Tax=Rhodofomes roseus TaxID=34475 RepID=A0ABQ8KDF0_9APHY|nr:uncharacterized protein C8Q71DRAFT_858533 [Rhodofomes roseus]KAH9835675.1 hypothetical protein C8Q71DRAFT_858533 [Rhodofomes roseus]
MPPIRTTTNTNGDTHRQRPLSLAPTAPKRDDCDDIRRKIRKLQRSQGFRITYWLRNIGGVKYNSWSRFMKAEGPSAGAENNIYYAAYVYFEKVRIAEGKKKPTKREQNELAYPQGFVMLDRRQTRDSTHH